MNTQSQRVIALGTASGLFAMVHGQYGIGAGVGALSLICAGGMEYFHQRQNAEKTNGGQSS